MASSSTNTSTYTTTATNYEELPLSSSSSFLNLPPASTSLFDSHLPSFLPTFRSPNLDVPSSSSHPPPQATIPSASASRPNNSYSKKRSRASRRAPTTVLTTDTSNFRAMVQEFTGFPAPPFPSSSSPQFPRPRLDLSSSPFLSRPFAQKLPAASPSSLVDAIASISSTNNYQFVNQSSLIGSGGIHNNSLLTPQFGDLGSLIAASEAMQQQQAAAGLPSWAADSDRQEEFGEGSSSRDHHHHHQDESTINPDHHELIQQPQKRQKTDHGVVESWIHSSD